ncbi:hypothetical protein [Aneurinibacillus aneurinilyticus]|jgi:hypothetical protein|uniref:Monovalent cation/H+ antiporter subunit G domain protein n=1 Tax=Aneurinibacillus aneurinilyticus ATCC 12856 TaxID=649747 RepID=U1X901_ANEAE|nr:hypothetical protein [Aneurinibacillus aneurinilyticus]ERI11450.1 monovalent cation/H+ antiporter subunit G domain protein [Aneurinibacillus aneurinilyticus ATCC 12856]MCI1694224.1 hypothetical protein [Aneurinibacillus aneurinilyticus]MED0671334.1 hypothetical protein [Aneurinibacillus aneurinilyticus]MED0707758.1 hypothetical protein [Aneurinibacillus aneurinilyticus]MED0722423.1 hypothetical protein [Aneurinibacillus aneurinilyticus]
MFKEEKMITILEVLLVASVIIYAVAYGIDSLYATVYAAMSTFVLGVIAILVTVFKRKFFLSIYNFLLVVFVFAHVMFFWNL